MTNRKIKIQLLAHIITVRDIVEDFSNALKLSFLCFKFDDTMGVAI